jgi:hypothetical protein
LIGPWSGRESRVYSGVPAEPALATALSVRVGLRERSVAVAVHWTMTVARRTGRVLV